MNIGPGQLGIRERLNIGTTHDFYFHSLTGSDGRSHYENLPMQYTEIFKCVKNENFQQKFFVIFAQIIDCGCSLEPPRLKV